MSGLFAPDSGALHPLRQWPDMVLRERCRPVRPEAMPAAAVLAERMVTVVSRAGALGLAASQLGARLAMFAFRDCDGSVRVAVNPRMEMAGGMRREPESCLSLGALTVDVDRYEVVRLRATGLDGELFELERDGLTARVLQHEADHLRGTLIIDRPANPLLLSEWRRDPKLGYVAPKATFAG